MSPLVLAGVVVVVLLAQLLRRSVRCRLFHRRHHRGYIGVKEPWFCLRCWMALPTREPTWLERELERKAKRRRLRVVDGGRL